MYVEEGREREINIPSAEAQKQAIGSCTLIASIAADFLSQVKASSTLPPFAAEISVEIG